MRSQSEPKVPYRRPTNRRWIGQKTTSRSLSGIPGTTVVNRSTRRCATTCTSAGRALQDQQTAGVVTARRPAVRSDSAWHVPWSAAVDAQTRVSPLREAEVRIDFRRPPPPRLKSHVSRVSGSDALRPDRASHNRSFYDACSPATSLPDAAYCRSIALGISRDATGRGPIRLDELSGVRSSARRRT